MKTVCKEPVRSLTSIEEFWTKERMLEAIPKPLPVYHANDAAPDNNTAKTRGPLRISPPNTSAKERLKSPTSGSTKLAKPVEDPTDIPNIYNGKLFFTWKGTHYVGSAGSIYLDVLLTAAHNIYDEGEWSDNFMYYPAYPDFGKSWSWSRAAIFEAWQNKTDFAYDYGMLLTDQPMSDVGSMASIQGLPLADRSWTAYGYPAAIPYPGNSMYKTTGNYVSGENIVTMNNNDMTQGSSGGSWITHYKGKAYVNGVQSTRGEQTNFANSPYLDSVDFEALLDCVATGNCT